MCESGQSLIYERIFCVSTSSGFSVKERLHIRIMHAYILRFTGRDYRHFYSEAYG